jgi:integrase/recombinase XerD
MLVEHINWSRGILTVWGKGQKESRLPLPQEVGDAVLAYLNKVRPKIAIQSLFLCLNTPYRSLGSSPSVSNIVRDAIKKAGILNPPSFSAGLLRH